VWSATIPGDYTKSAYPLQYYFEVTDTPSSAGFYPGLGEHLARQPYFVVSGSGRFSRMTESSYSFVIRENLPDPRGDRP
jgi:hypothetical protein